MDGENVTSAQEYLIVGFSDLPRLQVLLFCVFLIIYLMTLVGNLIIMSIIYSDSCLHTPMYFFITNLSFIDIIYTSVIFPEMLVHFFLEGTHISLRRCLLQMYLFVFLVATEFFLLTVMAYDRYVAICNPLLYMTIMTKSMCMRLAAGVWVVGAMVPIAHIIEMSHYSFCRSHTINHFFCDVTALMKLSCTSTQRLEIITYVLGSIVGLISFLLIIMSYISIISDILKIHSREGRSKAFSTCSSHLVLVILFYSSLCSMYMRPTSTYSMEDNKILSLSYIVITPLFNPIIYSLKNADFKNSIRKTRKTL